MKFHKNDIMLCIFGFVQALAAEVGVSFYIVFNVFHDLSKEIHSFRSSGGAGVGGRMV